MTWHVAGDPYFGKCHAVHVKHNFLHENQENPTLFLTLFKTGLAQRVLNKRNALAVTYLFASGGAGIYARGRSDTRSYMVTPRAGNTPAW